MHNRSRPITPQAIVGLAEKHHPKVYSRTIERGAVIDDGFSTLVFQRKHKIGWRVARVGRGGAPGWSPISGMGMVYDLLLELANNYAKSSGWWQRMADERVKALRSMSEDIALITVFDQVDLNVHGSTEG